MYTQSKLPQDFQHRLHALSRFAWPALLFLLCVGFYWKLVLTDQYTFLDNPDLAGMDLPRLQFQATEWRHSRFPLWDPHQWCGQPFLGQILGAAYPLNWPWFFLPFKGGKLDPAVLHWYFVAIHFLAAFFCYLLCRDLRRSRPASMLAGLVFALGGFLGNTDWLQVLNGALWAPLVFLFQLRALRGRNPISSAALAGLFLGIAGLSGHHEAPIYIGVTVAVVWLAQFFRPGVSRLAVLRLAAVCAAFTVLTAGFQVLPGYEYGQLARRWVGVAEPVGWQQTIPYTVHSDHSFTAASVLGIVVPKFFVHVNPFVGIAAFSLALLGVVTGWRRHRAVRLFVLVALGGLLFAMASGNMFHGLLYALLPIFGKARVPARAVVVFSFAIAPLVAFGVDELIRRRHSPWVRRLILGLLCTGGGIFALTVAASFFKPFDGHQPVMLTGLAAMLLAALLASWRNAAIGAGLLLAGLVFLVLMEIGNVSGADLANQGSPNRPGHLARLQQHNDIAAFLKRQPQPLRVNVNDNEIPYNFGDWHGIDTPAGYMAGVTANILDTETHTARTQNLLAVDYYIDREPRSPERELVFRGAAGLNVYRNPGAFPRVWTVHEAVRVASTGELRKAIQNPAWDLRAKAPMLSPTPVGLEGCVDVGAPRITAAQPARVRIEAEMSCRGMLVLANTDFPGWQVMVDGRPADVLQPYGALLGVLLERGKHSVEFRYRPASAIAGGLMTAAGFLGVAALALRDRGRRKRKLRAVARETHQRTT